MGRVAWLVVVGALVAACGQPKLHGARFEEPTAEPALKLGGFDLAAQRGSLVMLFFGYTHCPDVCPITLQQWAQVKSELGELGNNLQVIFVTVDPERDTPDLLAKYVPRFDPTFQALHGTQDDLKPLLAGLKVYAQKVENSKGEGYLMDHTAASFVFDQQGRTRLLVRHNADIKPVVADVRQILQGK